MCNAPMVLVIMSGYFQATTKYQVPKSPGETVPAAQATTTAPPLATTTSSVQGSKIQPPSQHSSSLKSRAAPGYSAARVKAGQERVEWGGFSDPSPALSRGE